METQNREQTHIYKWNIRFTPDALADKFKLPRGEAANFADAIAKLFVGPHPNGYILEDAPDTYSYISHGYEVVYQVLTDIRTIRVVMFSPIKN
ncbi:MAG: hypothetical protein AAF639_18295 [Chloroflexota bacterium]